MNVTDFIVCQFENDSQDYVAEIKNVLDDGSFECRFVHTGSRYTFSHNLVVLESSGLYNPGDKLSQLHLYSYSGDAQISTGAFVVVTFDDGIGYLGQVISIEDSPAEGYRIEFLHSYNRYLIGFDYEILESEGLYQPNTFVNDISSYALVDYDYPDISSPLNPDTEEPIDTHEPTDTENPTDTEDSTDSGTSLVYQVPGIIPVLQQPKSMDCWATVATMMYDWKYQQSHSIEYVVDIAGTEYRQFFDSNSGLPRENVEDFASKLGLKIEYPQSYAIEGLYYLLVDYGPIIIITDPDESPGLAAIHARILYGINSDGTAENTILSIVDPAQGTMYEEKLEVFYRKFEDMALSDNLWIQVIHF